MQGYNAQAATNERQIVIAAELTNSSADFGQIEPMVNAVRRELRAAGVAELPEVVLADAGDWHQVQMQALVADGIAVLILPDANKRKGARPGWDGGLYVFMRRVLATPTGTELYLKRTAMIEPVFGDTKFNRKIDRFQRRGRAACHSEWRLITATHNLLSSGARPRRPTPPERPPARPRALPRKRPRQQDAHLPRRAARPFRNSLQRGLVGRRRRCGDGPRLPANDDGVGDASDPDRAGSTRPARFEVAYA